MGTAIIVFHSVGNRSRERASMPVARLPGSVTEVITTSTGASAASVTAAVAGDPDEKTDGGFVTVHAVGANLWVTSALAPVAAMPAAGGAAGTGFPVMSGTFQTFGVTAGHKIAAREFV
jgi:hypothetical protein